MHDHLNVKPVSVLWIQRLIKKKKKKKNKTI